MVDKIRTKLKDLTMYKVFILLVISFVLKNLFAYFFEFTLGITGIFQIFIAILNTIAIGVLFYSLPLLSRKYSHYLFYSILVNIFLTILLISNIYYYREFSDFMSIDTVLKAGSNSAGLTGALSGMFKTHDLLYIVDPILLILYTIKVKFKSKTVGTYRKSVAYMAVGVLLCTATLGFAEMDRPQLLTRSFDNNYLVKYLGLAGFTSKSLYDYNELKILRADASENDLSHVLNYVESRKSSDSEYTGVAKGKNVIYIHLESFQQFLIDYKLKDENSVEHEVTPFINSLYHSNDTLAFDNSFHQVGQGKTSDAELMIENSLYGSESGSAMVKFGTDNTFYSAPTIFGENGYTTSVFHGNRDTFWNRNNAYKSFGYDNFYSLKYFENQDIIGYGLKDDVFFNESFDMYSKIEGLKYTKFIPVSNHFPYATEALASDFPTGNTGDSTVDNYFVTANYMDKQLETFYNKLVESGEADNTIFVLYGDHYGISNARNKTLNELLNLTEDGIWTGYNNAMMQRVPLIFNIPNSNVNPDKEINHKYVGQIDILPTLLNLMGIEDDGYIFMGQNVFGNNYDNIVEMRDGSFVTDKYTYYKGKAYYTNTGEQIDLNDELNKSIAEEIDKLKTETTSQLSLSDEVLNKDLLKFKYEKEELSDYHY